MRSGEYQKKLRLRLECLECHHEAVYSTGMLLLDPDSDPVIDGVGFPGLVYCNGCGAGGR